MKVARFVLKIVALVAYHRRRGMRGHRLLG